MQPRMWPRIWDPGGPVEGPLSRRPNGIPSSTSTAPDGGCGAIETGVPLTHEPIPSCYRLLITGTTVRNALGPADVACCGTVQVHVGEEVAVPLLLFVVNYAVLGKALCPP
jgi:hypothetical protein